MGYVYLIRNGDLYKIGRTDNLQRRLKQLQPCTLIQSLQTDRSRDLEYELHKKYKSKRLPQTEYFRLSESQVEDVSVALGKDPTLWGGVRRTSGFLIKTSGFLIKNSGFWIKLFVIGWGVIAIGRFFLE